MVMCRLSSCCWNTGQSRMLNPTSGETPLIHAFFQIANSDEDVKKVVEFLLDKGAEVNASRNDGMTALHWACLNGYLESVRLLLDHGAALEATDNENRTPLHMACRYDHHLGVVEELVQRGADILARSEDDETPLDVAV